jgi:quinol monooxygenase YgiN
MFMVLIQCSVQPEHRAAFLAGAADLRRATRAEPGNIAYGCFEDPAEPGRMTFVEEWQSCADIDAHMAQPYTQAFLQAALAMLAAPPSMRAFEVGRMESLL